MIHFPGDVMVHPTAFEADLEMFKPTLDPANVLKESTDSK